MAMHARRSALKWTRLTLGLLLIPWLPIGAAEGPGFWTTSASILRFRDESNRPFPPVHVAGNIYHVGAADLAVFLITTPAGHILLDSGFEETVPLIRTNIHRLGFKLEDVKILLASHAHMDHVSGHAEIRRLTGAKVMAMEMDADVLAAGGKGDFRWEKEAGWAPVPVDRVLKDGDTVTLGGTCLMARLTPGHSKGSTTWTTAVEEGGRTWQVVFAGSPNINDGVVLVNNPKYPSIAADYERTFRVLKSLPCDIFLTGHGTGFGLEEKARRVTANSGRNPFIDPEGYRGFIERAERTFRERVRAERDASSR